jgi:penicillin amidase
VINSLLRDPGNPWWDDRTTDRVERRDDILLAAMKDARRELTSLISRDTSGWSWGKIHRATLHHQTLGSSGIGLLERLFNRGDHPVGGGPAVVNAMGFDDRQSYRVTSAPTMRMTVDLADPDRSVWVNQSGASGHAFHPNYDDQTEMWATNRTWPFLSSRAAVDASTTDRLLLQPSG